MRSKRRLRRRQGPTKLRKIGLGDVLTGGAKAIMGYGGAAAEARLALNHAKAAIKAIKSKSKPKTSTQTQTRTNHHKDWSMNDSQGVKYKNVTISYKPTKRGRFTKALSQQGQTYYYTTGGQTSPVGGQGASNITNLVGSELLVFHQNLNDGIALTTPRSNENLYFEGSKDELQFKNCSPITIELDIYVLIDKTTQVGTNDPGTIWTNGIAQEQNDAIAPAEAFSTPWLKPTGTKNFNINFWTKRYPVTLTAGEKCQFNFTFKRKRMLDTSYIQNFNLIRGLTHRIFMVQRGTIVDGNNDPAFTAGNQSLGQTKVVWLQKRTLFGSLLATLPKVVKQTGVQLPATLPGQWHLDEDTGEAENAATVSEWA